MAPDRDKSVWGTSRDVWIDASPAHHLQADAPPMLILYADRDEDWRRQQNVEIAAATDVSRMVPVLRGDAFGDRT